MYQSILSELKLLKQSPKNYLFSFTYPTNKTISIQPYDPKAAVVAEKFIKEIKKKCPTLSVEFLGSAAMKIAGIKDIDLFATAPAADFEKYLPFLTSLFGPYCKRRGSFIEWNVEKKGFHIELSLIDPNVIAYQEAVKLYNLLQKNKALRTQYEKLKLSRHGTSIRNYHVKRMAFFNRVLGL